MKMLPVIEVRWVDSAIGLDTWDEAETKDCKVVNMISCGFLVREDAESLVLASDAYDDGRWRRVLVIPKVAIKYRGNP